MNAQDVGVGITFWAMAVVSVGSALAVVLLRDLFRSAVFLVTAFLSVAVLYVLLEADFLAAVQVLIYAGAIAILLIFAIMLTRDVQKGGRFNKYAGAVGALAILVFVTIAVVVLNTDWVTPNEAANPVVAGAIAQDKGTTAAIADTLFNKYVLPMEAGAALLLAAMIGALSLGRER